MNFIPDFEDIRPYQGKEVRAAIQKILKDDGFYKITDYLFPDLSRKDITDLLDDIESTYEFQKRFGHVAIRTILRKTSAILTYDGFENINEDDQYLYISNHRDIFLDSGLLQILLFENNLDTTQVAFGTNLMASELMTNLCKSNKLFSVVRNGTNKELYHHSLQLSEYIRQLLVNKTDSVWIAQRNGRTKDGIDKTQAGLLKMLNSSGKGKFFNNFKELNILPMAVSYEYEPCDALKITELYQSLNSQYVKKPGEDLQSIITGVTELKGRIHLSVGSVIRDELNALTEIPNENDKIKTLANMVDEHIYREYRLWPTNYAAYDILNDSNRFTSKYTNEEKERFVDHMNGRLESLNGDKNVLKEMFLKLYANPVFNCDDSINNTSKE